MKCYQIDFRDGNRMHVDANNEQEARDYASNAMKLAGHDGKIESVTILDD